MYAKKVLQSTLFPNVSKKIKDWIGGWVSDQSVFFSDFFFQLDKFLALIDRLQKSQLDAINIFVTKFGL